MIQVYKKFVPRKVFRPEGRPPVVLYNTHCIAWLRHSAAHCARRWLEACITDPPYPRVYESLYWDIAYYLKALLVRGGSYMAIIPHYNIPKVTHKVGEILKYRWMDCMYQEEGRHPRMAMGVEVLWKPIGWWVNEAWPNGRGFVKDGFKNPPPIKDKHPWAQSIEWAYHCLDKVPAGGTVLDPLMGTGTVGVACIERGHPFVGIELDFDTYNIAIERIEEALR
jgi:DNA modification methylase